MNTLDYQIFPDKVIEGGRELPVIRRCDVLVAGGGISGLIAAVAAARTGVKTVLVERNAFLGGVATAGMMHVLNQCRHLDGIALEMVRRLEKTGGVVSSDFLNAPYPADALPVDVEAFKEVALDMCMEAGVDLLLYSLACEPIMQGAAIKGITVENKSGRQAVLAEVVIDCTGDGDMLYRSGAPVVKGREEDGKMRPFAKIFHIGGLDIARMIEYMDAHPFQWQKKFDRQYNCMGTEKVLSRMSGFYDLVEEARRNGDVDSWLYFIRLEALFIDRGTALCNTSRIYHVDGSDVDDLTKSEIAGFKHMRMIVNFFRKYVPGGEHAYILDSASMMGVRETRRAKTEYIVSTGDVYADRDYPDTVLTIRRAFPLKAVLDKADFHSPNADEGSPADLVDGIEGQRNPVKLSEEITYRLPYRILVPLRIDGLLVSGRLMGVEHMVETNTREMTFCMMLGQVAGAAAALCVKDKVSPRALPFDNLKKILVSQNYIHF